MEPRVIKKYPNRRLYDTQICGYVTVKELLEIVQGGEPIRVIENATKNDITVPTLLQVFAESDESEQPLLSADVLAALIRRRSDVDKEALNSSILAAVQNAPTANPEQ